jgi:Fe-S oxidoreductase
MQRNPPPPPYADELDRALRRGIRGEVRFDAVDSGCCGMAGAFGFEKEHYDVSMKAGERVLLPRVRNADPATLIITDGFSYREQIAQGAGRHARHLAGVYWQQRV